MANHWSDGMYTLFWRDSGSGRARVTMAKEAGKLLRQYTKLWHTAIDAALRDPAGKRVPLRLVDDDDAKGAKPKKKAKPKARKAKAAPQPQAALVG